MTPFYRFAARGAIIPFLKMVSRQTVSGLENIPREGGFIAVANHLTDLDSLTAMRALVDADVPVYSLAKSTLFKVPVLGSILRAGGQIPVQRGTQNAATALKAASEVLADGGAIMIFPEGTLSRDPLKWPMDRGGPAGHDQWRPRPAHGAVGRPRDPGHLRAFLPPLPPQRRARHHR